MEIVIDKIQHSQRLALKPIQVFGGKKEEVKLC